MAATARKLVVEVVEARDLLPKDGTGTSSPYACADFDGQRRETRTVPRNLNPVWNERLEFNFPGGIAGEPRDLNPVWNEPLKFNFPGEPLEVEVAIFHDVRVGPGRRNNFLGRVRLDARQFVRKGEEALIYFPLEKESFFSWEPPKIDAPPPAPDASPVCTADPPRVQTKAVVSETAQGAPPACDEASTEKKPPEGDANAKMKSQNTTW